ncbi:hypothetical protein C7974DRAFT_428824 [Boeremia exigua]|uniref:uncharacterized protein n=1 Tax=Boeremia exigua TaxID=749465 RepID=UPI001E8DD635|nr:uncharacterized protein C7974DRAFT_428824 [Boeremia exigua]KAH6613131.1 hypothetical protein C7974DRAFT_428824 [Boeremia exigua]
MADNVDAIATMPEPPPSDTSSTSSYHTTDVVAGKPTVMTSNTRLPRVRAFEGAKFRIHDGTRWKVLQPLTKVDLQQEYVPCEGSQVFSCISLDKAIRSKYGTVAVKIRFQVCADPDTIAHHQHQVQRCADMLAKFPTQPNRHWLSISEKKLALCTRPAAKVNDCTLRECIALDRLTSRDCEYTPWMEGYVRMKLSSKCHPAAIGGGYCVFIVTDKLNATTMSHDDFCQMSLKERDRIREAIKTALLSVWACYVQPSNYSMKNFLWDEKKEHFYIVGFENCLLPSLTSEPQAWSDSHFAALNLTEDQVLACCPQPSCP